MYKVICLSTAELVDPGSNHKNIPLGKLISKYACYRTIYGLHFYTLDIRSRAMPYLNGREIIAPHLLQIIEVPDV